MKNALTEETMDKNMRQRGFINFGDTLNKAEWIKRAEADGYTVRDCGSYAELWNEATQQEKSNYR